MEDIDPLPNIFTETIVHLINNTESSSEQNDIQKIALIEKHYKEIFFSNEMKVAEAQNEATRCKNKV